MNVLKFKLGHPLVVGVVALIVLATIASCGSSSTEGIVASAAPAATPEAAPAATPKTQPPAALKACAEARWGEICADPPKIFYAADVPESVRQWLDQALVAATKEWGNYGPLEYWVAGVDRKASEELS